MGINFDHWCIELQHTTQQERLKLARQTFVIKDICTFESKYINYSIIWNKAVKSSYIRKSWSSSSLNNLSHQKDKGLHAPFFKKTYFQWDLIFKTIDNTIIEYNIVVDFSVPVAQLDQSKSLLSFRSLVRSQSGTPFQFQSSSTVEQRTVNARVGGSNPSSGAIF